MAAIRSFVKIQPITGKSGIAQNMDQVRKGINRMGSVTDGIAKSFYDTTELLKFEKEYLSDTSKAEVTDIKKKDKKDKTKWSTSMRDFRRTFRKKKRDRLEEEAEQGVEEGKEEGRKAVEKQKPKLNMLGGFFNGLFKVFKLMIIFGALNWLSNPKNAKNAVKVFKILFAIGKFAFKVTKFGVGLLLDGLTNVIGNFEEEGAIRRAFRGILGVVKMMGGLAALRTAQYLIMPWKLMKDVNRLRMIFQMSNEQSAEQDANQKVRKKGYRDKKTGVIYSEEEYKAMKKSADKAARKNPGAGKAFEDRFGKESRFTKFKGKASAARKRFGAGANKAFGKLGGKLNVGMSVIGGAGRIASGLASGEKASSAVGAGVGQAAGGLIGGIAGTALLGPFLGPFAPIVGNAIGSFLGEWVGKELGPIMEPIFGPIGRAFKMMFKVLSSVFAPLFEKIREPLGMIFQIIGELGKVLMGAAKILGDFIGFIFGGLMDAIKGTVQFVVNNAKRLMDPASVGKGILDAMTLNLFDFDGENKKAAGGPVEMAAGGPLQFGSHPDMLASVGGIYLKTIVGAFGAFGFVGNKVKSVLAPDIQKIASGLGVQVSTGGGRTAGGVSNSVQFQATQTEKQKVEAVKNLTYKENIYNAIDKGLNKLLLSGLKIFDPEAAKKFEEQRQQAGGGQPQQPGSSPGSSPNGPSGFTGVGGATGSKNEKAVLNAIADAEGTTQYPNKGYNTQYTGKQFTGDKHPRQILGPSRLRSDAAGRYQFLSTTWDEVMGDPITPERQDQAALKLVKRRNVDISNGLSIAEVYKLGKEWASIEGGGYGQAKYSAETFLGMYEKYGGERQMAAGGHLTDAGLRAREKKGAIRTKLEKAKRDKRNKNIPGRSTGGFTAHRTIPDTPSTSWAAGIPLTRVRSQSGSSAEVALALATRFQGFIDDLEATGYNIKEMGGFRPDGPPGGNVDGKGPQYAHPYGAAIDINWTDNPAFTKIPANKWGDFPSNSGDLAAKYGLGWGGNFDDAMHFSAMKREYGTGIGGQEITGEVVRNATGAEAVVSSTGGSQPSTSTSTGGSQQQQEEAKPEKPKTLEEMMEAFKTGLTSALTKISTNIKATPQDPADTSEVDAAFAEHGSELRETPANIDSSKIRPLGAVRDKAVQDLRAIADKAQRDEEANIVPVVTERLVVQKITQQINTRGNTSAVYTKPSPLLTK